MLGLRLTALCAAGMLGLGCLADLGDPMGRQRALKESQHRYTQLVRWGELEEASEFVDPELREAFLELVPAFEAIRITDYERGKFSFDGPDDTANITVTYRGYSVANLVEQPVREDQEWFRVGANTWQVRPDIEEVLARFQHPSQ